MNPLLFLTIIVSFFVAVIILPLWIKKCKKVGLLWEDMNKFSHPKNVASSGGIVVVMAFVLGVLTYVAIKTFVFGADGSNLEIFSLLSVILILSIVGLVDDLLGWQHGGLSVSFRLVLAIIASIPLIVINVGNPTMSIPFFGIINVGIFYAILFVPIGITGATTTYNMLAGMNGLEAGQGIIILSFLSFVAYFTGSAWLSIIGLSMVGALIGFYFFNKYPAKVFPGDILTYSVGALIACMAILGNFEKIAIFVFLLYIIETFLKVRGKLKKQSFGKPNQDGSLEMPYDKIYGMTHLSIFILKKFKNKVYEKDVVYFIYALQIILCIVAVLIFRNSIFIK